MHTYLSRIEETLAISNPANGKSSDRQPDAHEAEDPEGH